MMEPTVEVGVGLGSGTKPALGPVVQIDEGRIHAHLDEVVRSKVEGMLNALLDAEADRLCGASRYERSEGRKDTRAGSDDRHLQTKAGEVTLSVPRLRTLPFETAVIDQWSKKAEEHNIDFPNRAPRHAKTTRTGRTVFVL